MIEKNKYIEEFKEFMSSKNVYELNKDYWKTLIIDLVGDNTSNWVLNNYANGYEIKDGNPLFSVKLSKNKALRIIQEVRNPYSPLFASWVGNYEIEEDKIEELVIAIQPYRVTYSDSKKLIEGYLSDKYKSLQKELNVYYNKKTNKNRVQHLLRFLKNTEIKNNSWNIDRNEIVNNQINHNLFKKIHHLNQNLFYYKSVFDNKPIRKSYISTLKSIDKLNTIITLNYSYNLDKGFQSENYKKEIIKQYSNFQNYLEIYNSTVDDIEEKYLDLEKQFEETI